MVSVLATLEWSPEPGTSLKITRTSSAAVIGASTALELFNDPLVRDTSSGAVRLKINNLGSATMEVVTSENYGATPKARVDLRDQDGNLLATSYLSQRTGADIVNLGKTAVARIEPGASFISGPIDLKVPANAPASVVLEAVISNTYWHYGKTDQVSAPGMTARAGTSIQETAYRAWAGPEQDFYTEPQPVVITGQALDSATGAPVPNVPVRLGISVKGFDRSFNLTTDSAGNFTHTFTPGDNEAGLYSVWAAHPDVYDRTVQSTFAIAGFRSSLSFATITMPRGGTVNVPVTLMNVGGSSLNGLTFTTDASNGFTSYVLNGGDSVLNSGEKQNVTFRVEADADAPGTGSASMLAGVDEGLEVTLNSSITTVDYRPAIRTSPSYIDTGLIGGTQKVVSFMLNNIGHAALENAHIEGLSTPWMKLMVNQDIGNIAPGEGREISMMLAPDAAVPQGTYDDKLTIYSDNHIPYTYHIQVTVTDSDRGNVLFDVLDQFFGDVSGADITLQHQTTLELIYHTTTGADGTTLVTDIPEGRYTYNISPPSGLLPYSGSFVVEPGVTTTVPVALEVRLVDIEWSVTPVELEDRYEVNVQQTFETQVPAPVIVMEPRFVSVPYLEPGGVFNGELTVTNHGLVAADYEGVRYPTSIGDYDVEVLDTHPARLDAMRSVTIPYRVSRRAGSVATQTSSLYDEVAGYGGGTTSSSGAMVVSYGYVICPNSEFERIGKIEVAATVTVTNVRPEGTDIDTGGTGGGTTGGSGSGGSARITSADPSQTYGNIEVPSYVAPIVTIACSEQPTDPNDPNDPNNPPDDGGSENCQFYLQEGCYSTSEFCKTQTYESPYEVLPPDNGVYAIIDGSNEHQQFTKLRAKIQSTLPEGNSITMSGDFQAVLSFLPRVDDYEGSPAGTPRYAEQFVVRVSVPVNQLIGLESGEEYEFEFDFGKSPIPVEMAAPRLMIFFNGAVTSKYETNEVTRMITAGNFRARKGGGNA